MTPAWPTTLPRHPTVPSKKCKASQHGQELTTSWTLNRVTSSGKSAAGVNPSRLTVVLQPGTGRSNKDDSAQAVV